VVFAIEHPSSVEKNAGFAVLGLFDAGLLPWVLRIDDNSSVPPVESFRRSVGVKDGFVFGRDEVDAVPVVCFSGP
jgi:hypothetical protein